MNEKFKFSNAQVLTNLDSTGVISENIWDFEENAVTDDFLEGFVNAVITARALTSGLTEGLLVEFRTGDTTALDSLWEVCGAISLLKAKVIAGARFSIPVRTDKLQKYGGLFYRALSTADVGTITVDTDFSATPVGENATIQKMPS